MGFVHTRARGLLVFTLSALLLAACFDKSEQDLLASATKLAAQHDSDAAVLELKTLLQLYPQSAPGRLLFGKLLQDAGQPAAAESELRRALESGQPDADVLPTLAVVLNELGRGGVLLDQYAKVELKEPQADAAFKTELAVALASRGDLPAAMSMLDRAEAAAKDRTPVLLQRARLTARAGDRAAALAQVASLAERHPGDARVFALQGDLLVAEGRDRWPQAVAAWRKSLALKADNASVRMALAMALVESRDWAAVEAEWRELKKLAGAHPQTIYLEGLLAEHRGDWNRAREVAEVLIKRAPGNLRALMFAGRVQLHFGALAQAERLFGRAIQAAPQLSAPRQFLAQTHLRTGEPDKALESLRPLLQASPPDTESLLLAARAQLQRGDNNAAAALYGRAAQLTPSDPRVRTAAAIGKLARGPSPEAVAELRAVAAADKETTADLALINHQIGVRALDDAEKSIEVLAGKTPTDPQVDQFRARLALQRQDLLSARQHFAKALSRDPDYMPALMGLTSLDLLEKKPADAKSRLERVVERNGQHVAAMIVLAELNERSRGPAEDTVRWLQAAIKAAPSDAIPRLKLIDLYLRGSQLEPALEVAQAAVAVLPADPDSLERLGRVQLLKGEHAQATISFRKLVSLQPRSPLPHLRLADALAASGDSAAAVASVRRAIEINPEDPGVQRAAIGLLRSEGKAAQAAALAKRLQSRDPIAGLTLEGELAAERRDWATAASAYRKLMAAAPRTDTALRLHGVLLAAGRTAEAGQFVVGWRKSHPDDLAFLVKLGDAAMARGQAAQAEQFYREVLARKSGHLPAMNNLAYALVRQRKPGAVALAEEVVKQAPDAAAFQDTLAYCLAAENQVARAVEVQTRAVELAPEAHGYRLQLAQFLLRAGDKGAAVLELQKLEKLGSGYARQADVKALLRAARG